MPEAQCDSQRPAGVASRRLDPDLVEDALAQDATVADAVERDPACQAEVIQPGFAVGEASHLHHDLFGDLLHGAREVHLELGQLRLGAPRWTPEQLLERPPGHRQPMRVREVLHVQPQAALVADLEQVVLYRPDVFRLAVNAEYSSPSECGKRSSWSISMPAPRPTPTDEVAHSPTPSIVTIAASSKGEG